MVDLEFIAEVLLRILESINLFRFLLNASLLLNIVIVLIVGDFLDLDGRLLWCGTLGDTAGLDLVQRSLFGGSVDFILLVGGLSL